jgi:hypothetical protein
MNFENYDLIPTLARERQQRLIEEAAERRLVRQAKEAHPSAGRWSRLFHHDPAS